MGIGTVQGSSNKQWFRHPGIKLLVQSKQWLCWETCARMVYLYKNPGMVREYEKFVASYIALGTGLRVSVMDNLYRNILKMSSATDPIENIKKSPLIWVHRTGGEDVHAMLLIGYHYTEGFINFDPAATMNFKDEAQVTAKSATMGPPQLCFKGNSFEPNVKFRTLKAVKAAPGVWGYI